MKQLIILLLAIMLFSCKEDMRLKEMSNFVVYKTIQNEAGICIYVLSPINNTGIQSASVWIADSIGKFNVEDTVIFEKVKK